MRNDEWLKERMEMIWQKHFPDISRENKVLTIFKGKWKNRLGYIKMLQNKNTVIVINSLFKDERVPEFVINTTLAHEIIHYMHGFQSPKMKQFDYPHKGQIVNREIKRRGLGEQLRMEKDWIKKCWLEIYKSYFPKTRINNFEEGKVFVRKKWFDLF